MLAAEKTQSAAVVVHGPTVRPCDPERRVADDRGEQVVEEAVGRERILAGEPEVVPDEDPLAREERAIEVRGQIAAWGNREEDERGHRPRDTGTQNELAVRPCVRAHVLTEDDLARLIGTHRRRAVRLGVGPAVGMI